MALCVLLLQLVTVGSAPALDAADQAFEHIDYPVALAGYMSIVREVPDDVGVLWRLARVYVCMAEVADEPQRGLYLRRGEEYARKCITADSMSAEGHTWLTAALGYIAFYGTKAEQVKLTWEILREADKAIELNPKNDAAFSIKGSLFRALGNAGWLERQLAQLFFGRLPDGGYEESEAALLRAIALGPDVMRHSYELAVLYIDWGRKEEAKKFLIQARSLPIRVAIDRPRLVKIQELLSGLDEEGR
jgi:tetratricopeptide (TPR) repeat protein